MKTRSVLIVDDDCDIRTALCDALSNEGFSTHAVESGADAMKYLQREGEVPCLILSDLRMPGMDGWDFVDTIKKRLGKNISQIPVVVMSALSAPPPNNLFRFIKKPFELDELVSMVREHCGN